MKAGALGRLRWSLRMRRRPTSIAGLLRLWWADFIVHPLFESSERCQDCGRGYVAWLAGDLLYREVHGSPHGTICPACFARQAAAKGIVVRFGAQALGAHDVGTPPLVPLHPNCRCAETPVVAGMR